VQLPEHSQKEGLRSGAESGIFERSEGIAAGKSPFTGRIVSLHPYEINNEGIF
jgi:hypothetical protein